MSGKSREAFASLWRGTYSRVSTDGSNEETEGLVYDEDGSMTEKRTLPRSKVRSFMKPLLQSFLVAILMVVSYFYGAYASTLRNSSAGFIPDIPLKSEPGTFSDDHTWIGPGKESDILWAKEYQIMSDHKFIKIDDPRKYNIPPGQEDSDGVNFYSISVYHQLHCLALFRALVYDESLSQNDGDHKRALSQNRTWADWYHLGHCFNYLRQAIRCTVDTTLEYPPGNHTAKHHTATRTGNRQCRDISVLDQFVEDNKWVAPS